MGRAPMRGVRVSAAEVARRKAFGAAMWERIPFPPLYRVSSMDPETVLHGAFGASSPVMTYSIFAGDADFDRPYLEVYTVVRGTVEAAAPILWFQSFRTSFPKRSGEAKSVSVTVSGSPSNGSLLAATAEGWTVSVETPDATVLVMGPGELPNPLALEPVDMQALKRSEFRNSGIPEG